MRRDGRRFGPGSVGTPPSPTTTGLCAQRGDVWATTTEQWWVCSLVMARVPTSDGQRGGITAFVVEADSEGINSGSGLQTRS